MKVYRSLADVSHDELTIVTIGTFDGVHRGHRTIIDAVIEKARAIGGRSLVITFHPHPQAVLRKTGDAVPLLTTLDERIEELEKLGIDAMVVLNFTLEFAQTPWQMFCAELVNQVGVTHMIVGHDHAFGKNREGNVESLKSFGSEHGFSVEEIGPLLVDDDTISSTKIRRALLAGDIAKASYYLGRHYSLQGTVVRGDGRGRELGIPTANIHPLSREKLIPANGVYCVSIRVDSETFTGMANIGVRPTFTDSSMRTIEVNIFGFERDIYEQTVKVEFRKFVRSEQKFNSKEAFLQQLESDRKACLEDAS